MYKQVIAIKINKLLIIHALQKYIAEPLTI